MFLGLIASVWASGAAEAAAWHWASALILLAAGLAWPAVATRTWIGASVLALTAWTLVHTLFIASSYSPAGLFHPLFLLTGFALGKRAPRADGVPILEVASFATLTIVCYALVVAGPAGAALAAPFETPAALAALINLALLPLLVLALWEAKRSWLGQISIALLFAGLIGAASRGGWIGLLVGLGFAALIFHGRLPAWRNALWVAGSACLGAGIVAVVRAVGILQGAEGASHRAWAGLPALFSPSALQVDSSLSRLELYAAAFDAVLRHSPFGSGYLSFAQVLEAARARVPSYGSENVTFFVHNDYLQTLLELGLPGAGALLVVVLLPLGLLLLYRDRLSPREVVRCTASAAALAAMAFQGGVDFPFYIPVCLAVFGVLLGTLDARFISAGVGLLGVRLQTQAREVASIRRITLATGAVLLLVPLAAEWSLAYGNARWKEGLGEKAAYGFELARRLQPADWRYAWFAGKFWTAQAAATRKPEAAKLADASFARGFEANPLEVKNLLGRIELQRSLGHLLEKPASPLELESWSATALTLAPLNQRVRLERILVLEKGGDIDAARTEAARFALEEPGNRGAWFLAERLARRPH